MKRSEIQSACERLDLSILLMDGMDEAFIGIVEGNDPRAAYSYERIIDVLKKRGLNNEEAVDYFDYNIKESCVSKLKPIIIRSIE